MDLTEERVTAMETAVGTFAKTWNADQAERHITARVTEARKPFIVAGIDGTPEGIIERHERAAAQEWDTSALQAGVTLETDLDGAIGILQDRIAEAKVLAPHGEPLRSQEARQREELIALFSEDRFTAQAATLTRTQALDRYARADETTATGRRFAAWLESAWRAAPWRDDPDQDAKAIPALAKAIEARQLQRVPGELVTWHTRLTRARRTTTFGQTMAHLRSGRSLVGRRPQRVA